MTEDTQVVDPVQDNSTPPAPESQEQTTPVTDNVVETEPEQPAEPESKEVDNVDGAKEVNEIDEKEERYKQQLSGSKAEALRLKSEKEQLEAQLAQLSQAKQEQEDAGVPMNEQDLVVFNALAKKLGFVTKQEIEKENQIKTYSQLQEDSLNKFLTEHPEYNKPGDSESDKRWTELQKELTFYNTRPSDPKAWYTILSKAHNNLSSNTELARARGESIGMAKATLAEQAKMGNRASGIASGPTKKQTPEQQQFSQEIEEQLKKRPYYKAK